MAGKTSVVGGEGGGREACGVAENPGGGGAGSGRGDRVAAGHRHPQSGIIAPGDETPGVDTESNKVTGEEGRGRGGGGNSLTTQESEDSEYDGGNDGMVREPRMAVLPRLSNTAADDDSAEPLLRKCGGANSASSKNGMHPLREYNLLALEAPEGGRANGGASARIDRYRDTIETAEAGRVETPTESETMQRAPSV